MTLLAKTTEVKLPALSEPQVKLWTRDEYQQLGETNLFDEQRVELIEGEIVVVAPQKDIHAVAIGLVRRAVGKVFGDPFWIREQAPLGLGSTSEPEPDISVVRGDPREFIGRGHPSSAVLVVEVSQTTLRFDRSRKSKLYANNNIADYWIVNLVDQQLEVHSNPDPTTGVYKDVRNFKRHESISPLAASGASIAVADLLP